MVTMLNHPLREKGADLSGRVPTLGGEFVNQHFLLGIQHCSGEKATDPKKNMLGSHATLK